MKRLWQKDSTPDSIVERYTVGRDPEWDMLLIPYDLKASAAHARMLRSIGILNPEELSSILQGLDEIRSALDEGRFHIRIEDEDMHTAIENYLVDNIGDAGKKIHTGRSRNDQVLTALRLYMKDSIQTLLKDMDVLSARMNSFSQRFGSIPLPGYTHTRKAMPSSVALWTQAWIEALADNRRLLLTVAEIIDSNPLGTGAGYGVPLPLNRRMTAEELGFARPEPNPIYTQNSRSKFEGLLLHACTHILSDMNRMASDLILFTLPGLDYFILPESFTTGSSIMPQKMNPDLLEILRGSYHSALAAELQVRNQTIGLISGYHRDVQHTKGALIEGLQRTADALMISTHLFGGLSVNEAACRQAMTVELFAAEKAYSIVLEQGIPFRDAYRRVAEIIRTPEKP